MTTQLQATAGEDRDFPLQCWREGAVSAPVFGIDDDITAYISTGAGGPVLFEPIISWWDAPDEATGLPTQTGYQQGQVLMSVAADDTAQLSGEAEYLVELWWTPATTKRRHCVWRGTMRVRWAAGVSPPRVPTYCSFEDMLHYGPWCKYLQDQDAIEAGFYTHRLESRLWVDDLIVQSFRMSALYPFGTPAVPWPLWSSWQGPWRSPMPSVWLRDQLWGGDVRPPVLVTNRGAGYTWATVTAPLPPPSDLPQLGPRQRPAVFAAVLDGAGGIGAVLCQNRGFGYVPGRPLDLVIDGDGTGASAVASITPGALLLRNRIRRLAAYKALNLLGIAQMASNLQHVTYGEYFGSKASEELSGTVAELDVSGDGFPKIAVPLYVVNTIYQ